MGAVSPIGRSLSCPGGRRAMCLAERSRVRDDGASGVDDEEQYGRIVERSGSGRIRKQLGHAPGREGENCDKPHQSVSCLRRIRDAHGSDSTGD